MACYTRACGYLITDQLNATTTEAQNVHLASLKTAIYACGCVRFVAVPRVAQPNVQHPSADLW